LTVSTFASKLFDMGRIANHAPGLLLAGVLCACAGLHQADAQRELAEGRLDDAAADVQSALESNPDNLQLEKLAAEIFTRRGVKSYQNQEMLAAADDFHRAAGYYPTYAPAWDYLGLIAFSQHNWEEAIHYGEKAAALGGGPPPVYVSQARDELGKVRSGGLKPYARPYARPFTGAP
jgi:tetratricopeptide (TPR) repeat protein